MKVVYLSRNLGGQGTKVICLARSLSEGFRYSRQLLWVMKVVYLSRNLSGRGTKVICLARSLSEGFRYSRGNEGIIP
jgi:hypothetical protein